MGRVWIVTAIDRIGGTSSWWLNERERVSHNGIPLSGIDCEISARLNDHVLNAVL